MDHQLPCWLCESPSDRDRISKTQEVWADCGVCGPFYASYHCIEALKRPDNADHLKYLAMYVAEANDQGVDVHLTTDNWRQLADGQRHVPVSRKIQRLQELVARESPNVGAWVSPNPKQFIARVKAVSAEELLTLAHYLAEIGFIQHSSNGVPETEDGDGGFREVVPTYRLTVDGWRNLEPQGGAGTPGTCFVAMSFDRSLNDAYGSGIRAAVEDDCGLRVIRVDREQHNQKIDDFIIASIRGAQFVVADVTLQRAGVYFEAGWAMGLGKTVIWCVRADDLKNVHFDTRQFNHIVWTAPPDLRSQLTNRIRATVTIPARL